MQINLPGGFIFAPTLFQAIAVVILIFLLILTLGQLRRRYANWRISGILPGILFGFILALIIEALLVISGKTVFTEIMGWKSAPKPISNVLDAGQNKLKKTLGVSTGDINIKAQKKKSVDEILKSINNLTLQERLHLVTKVCEE